MIVFYIVVAILILMLMILIHELGHYLVGRWLGFKITEFSIGFGKAIWQRTNKRGEKISLRWIPLGGYCAFYGEDGEEEVDEEGKPIPAKDDPDFFTNQAPWKRILVFFAGVTFNFLSAIIFSFILLVSFGYGNVYVITDTNEYFVNSASATNQIALIEKGDKILQVDGKDISYVWGDTLENMITNQEGNSYTFTVRKASTGEVVEMQLEIQTNYDVEYSEELGINQIKYDEDNQAVTYTGLGLMLGISSEPLSFWDALSQCVSFTIGLAWLVLKTLWLLITFQLPLSALGGTVTVISTVASTVQQSFSAIFVYLPLIAANLAVFNILPFPALDGSHVAFTTVEWIRGKPVNRNLEAWIHTIGFFILIAFVILIDILHFVG